MKLNEKIKEYRKIFNLSQEQLAEKLSVSRQVITKWENDEGLPEIGNLKAISKIMGISIDYLLPLIIHFEKYSAYSRIHCVILI